MKYLFLILFVVLSGNILLAQQKISDVEYISHPDLIGFQNEFSYLNYNNTRYFLVENGEYLELINIDDVDDVVKRYKIELECTEILTENSKPLVVGNKMYLIRKALIQEFNLDVSEETNVFSFSELTFPDLGVFRLDNMLIGYETRNSELTIELIDLETKSTSVLKFGEYELVRNVNGKLIAISDARDEVVHLDVESGQAVVLHQGEDLVLANNFSAEQNEIVFLDGQTDFFRLDLVTMEKETICIGYEHSNIFYITNTPNYIYYSAIPNGFTNRFFFGINKEDCQVKYSNPSDGVEIEGHYFTDENRYTILKDNDSIIFVNEGEDTVFNNGFSYPHNTSIGFNDHLFYAFCKDTSGGFTYRLDRVDLDTDAFEHFVFTFDSNASVRVFGDEKENTLTVVGRSNFETTLFRLNTESSGVTVEPFLSEKDYGLRYNSLWEAHGTSVSSILSYRDDDLIFVQNDVVKRIQVPDFIAGAYRWNESIAGIVQKDDDYLFTIYNTQNEIVEDEVLIEQGAAHFEQEFLKVGDKYYYYDNNVYEIYPEHKLTEDFSGVYLNKQLVQSEYSVVFIAFKENFDGYRLISIEEEGVKTIVEDLPSNYYKEYTLWTDTGVRRLFVFADNENDRTLLVSIGIQTGEVFFDSYVDGVRKSWNPNPGYEGWMTFIFQSESENNFIGIATNGKEIKTYQLSDWGFEPKVNSSMDYINQKLVFEDEKLNTIALDENGSYQAATGELKFQNTLYDSYFYNGKYYFVGRDWESIKVFQTNENLKTEAVLFSTDQNNCNPWWPLFLGTGTNGELFFTLNTIENGYEIWYIDPSNNSVKLLKDINGIASSSFKRKAFYLNDAYYFIATDEIGNYQLYKLALGKPTVNTEEVGERKMKALTIYPNPTEERLSFDIILIQLVIRDVTGKIVRSEFLKSGIKTLRINELKAGIYFIEGYDEEGNKYIQKFVKV